MFAYFSRLFSSAPKISSKYIQFIDQTGTNQGKRLLAEVMNEIDSKTSTLVQVNKAEIPVVKAVSIKELIAKKLIKPPKNTKTKHLDLNLAIDEHDLKTKMRYAEETLEKGNVIQVSFSRKKFVADEKQKELIEKVKAWLLQTGKLGSCFEGDEKNPYPRFVFTKKK